MTIIIIIIIIISELWNVCHSVTRYPTEVNAPVYYRYIILQVTRDNLLTTWWSFPVVFSDLANASLWDNYRIKKRIVKI